MPKELPNFTNLWNSQRRHACADMTTVANELLTKFNTTSLRAHPCTLDGNDLFNSLSCTLYGNENLASIIRLCTFHFMCKHYNNLLQTWFAEYADVCDSPEVSVKRCATRGGASNVLTMLCAVNALQISVRSVYPPYRGLDCAVLSKLNRLFKPLQGLSKKTVYIMWVSQTICEMVVRRCLPLTKDFETDKCFDVNTESSPSVRANSGAVVSPMCVPLRTSTSHLPRGVTLIQSPPKFDVKYEYEYIRTTRSVLRSLPRKIYSNCEFIVQQDSSMRFYGDNCGTWDKSTLVHGVHYHLKKDYSEVHRCNQQFYSRLPDNTYVLLQPQPARDEVIFMLNYEIEHATHRNCKRCVTVLVTSDEKALRLAHYKYFKAPSKRRAGQSLNRKAAVGTEVSYGRKDSAGDWMDKKMKSDDEELTMLTD